MNTWKPLPIWCADGELDASDLGRVRDAKRALGLDYFVKPEIAEPSITDRVLAWGSAPPFAVAYALVDPDGPAAELEEALAWVLWEHDVCRVAMTLEDALAAMFLADVQEVAEDVLAAERRLSDYEAGR